MSDGQNNKLFPRLISWMNRVIHSWKTNRGTTTLSLPKAPVVSKAAETKSLRTDVKLRTDEQASTRSSASAKPNKTFGPVPPGPVAGNYFIFDLLLEIEIERKIYTGHPCIAFQGPSRTRWGPPDVKYLLPSSNTPRGRWIDDPERGISRRVIVAPEDLLGAEGTIGGKRCLFEQILDPGKNVLVYSIFFPDRGFRIAYGFSREICKPN